MTARLRPAAALCLGTVAAVLAAAAPSFSSASSTNHEDTPPGAARAGDLRYSIVGRVRLAVVWVSREVGSARLTWSSQPHGEALTLIAGSDPQIAPRRLNQWTYLREETDGDRADVFTLRSTDDVETRSANPLAPGRGSRFAVSCGAVSGGGAFNHLTTIDADGVTYRMFPQLLDRVQAGPAWRRTQAVYPAGAHPGFLLALRAALNSGEAFAALSRRRPLLYLYNGALYELSAKKHRSLGATAIGTRTFPSLVDTDFLIRNVRTNAITKFEVSAGIERGTVVPVRIAFQPSFWMGVELRLDENADAPREPTTDPALLKRMRQVCGAPADDVSRR
jgi:hypothetical protein